MKKNPKKQKKSGKLTSRLLSSKFFIFFSIIISSLFLFAIVLIVSFLIRHAGEPTQLGVSFSKNYAEELGINWQTAYEGVLRDLGFRKLRLMSYWDEHEKERDQYDFTSLDWQMDLAAKYKAKVSLAIGHRQPRWPECHTPNWAKKLERNQQDAELLEYLEAVTLRYRDHPALESYQLENEIFNRLFGECPDFDRDLLAKEYGLVKKLDPAHSVIINVSNQSGTPVRQPVGDEVGFSMYKKAYGEIFGMGYYWSFWYVPSAWHTLRAAVIELLHSSPTFVHELQTEPWGPVPTKDMTIEEQNKSMDSEQLKKNIRFAENTGMSRIYIWGAEWWYWRMDNFNDPSLWNTVQEEVAKRPYPL
ncbi:hypothetical protein DYH10_04265 [Candidatus Saccharibacteria bacterium CPR2]|nr:hypothetical protein [Candidatus Saccharibacteria bacterium CPR2]